MGWTQGEGVNIGTNLGIDVSLLPLMPLPDISWWAFGRSGKLQRYVYILLIHFYSAYILRNLSSEAQRTGIIMRYQYSANKYLKHYIYIYLNLNKQNTLL